MEFLALVYGDPDTWERLSEDERSAAYEGYMAVSRDADGGRRARRRERARVDDGGHERAGAQRRDARDRRARTPR